MFRVHRQPIRVLLEEAFSFSSYPWSVAMKTPTGDVSFQIYSSADLSTANLVFCRQDYHCPRNARVVVDIGSNIGLSSLYWLTRNPGVRVSCYEPSPISYPRLTRNLAPYADRVTLQRVAVSDFRGLARFGMEPSGVNSSLDLTRATAVTDVQVWHINDVLEAVLSRDPHIDMLKLDNEGHEFRTLAAIAPEYWCRISYVNVGCHDNRLAVPSNYQRTQVGSAERYRRLDVYATVTARVEAELDNPSLSSTVSDTM
jgi:FkbM family methyltransferase